MKTRTINTEILFNLSSSTNISDSLNKFGSQDSDKSFLVVSVDKDLESVKSFIQGEWSDVNQLSEQLDKDLLIKVHKLKPDEMTDLIGSLCSRISAKDSL